ncbi:MAG: NADH-quinone oxidoreductase subunit NuoK [Candidatus Aminicenantes bacterium]|nr:NADH-quinone oxidoreductase subunit NuoK [Candidatus Aminicenantes bacterium]
MIPASWFLALSGVLFALGVLAFLIKKDLLLMFLAVEVMLNAANLAFVAFARRHGLLEGQAAVFFIITVAAAEAAVGLAIILLVFRRKKTVKADEISVLKG